MEKNITFNNLQKSHFKDEDKDKNGIWCVHKLSEQTSLLEMSVLAMRLRGDDRYRQELENYHSRMINKIVKIANYYDIKLQKLIILKYFIESHVKNKGSIMSLQNFDLSIKDFQTLVLSAFPKIDSKLHYTEDNGINNLEDSGLKKQLYVDFGYSKILKAEVDALFNLMIVNYESSPDIKNKIYECLLWTIRTANHFGIDLEHSISINYNISKEISFEKIIK